MSRRRSARNARSAAPPPAPTPHASDNEAVERLWRLLAAGSALAFVFFALSLVRATPLVRNGSLINAPDEFAHVGYVRALAEGHRLPLRDDPVFRTYQWHQPPLYYLVAALASPLGLQGMRAVSILFAVISLWAIWSAARVAAPGRYVAHTLTVMLVALLPMRQAVMSAVGNDSATECVFSLSLCMLLVVSVRGLSALRVVALTFLLAAGLLTKASCVLLLPVAFPVLWLASPRTSVWRRVARSVLPIAGAVAVAGPWFVRNARIYGEALPLRAFHAEFANTSRAGDWIGRPVAVDPVTAELRPGPAMDRVGYATLVGAWTSRTFLAAYTPPSRQAIGAPTFLPVPAYALYALLALFGLSASLPAVCHAWRTGDAWRLVIVSQCAVVLLVGASFVAFTTVYFQAQGRYLYPALLPAALLWGIGAARVIPPRHAALATALLLAVLCALSAAFCFAYVWPAYASANP